MHKTLSLLSQMLRTQRREARAGRPSPKPALPSLGLQKLSPRLGLRPQGSVPQAGFFPRSLASQPRPAQAFSPEPLSPGCGVEGSRDGACPSVTGTTEAKLPPPGHVGRECLSHPRPSFKAGFSWLPPRAPGSPRGALSLEEGARPGGRHPWNLALTAMGTLYHSHHSAAGKS